MSEARSDSQEVSPVERSDEIILRAFARLDRTAFGTAVGTLLGSLIFSATVFVIAKHGKAGGINLELLAQYYPGYTVSFPGAFLGFFYGFLTGFFLGWFIALLRNASLGLYLRFLQRKTELSRIHEFLDQI
jgi:hypothetical protein